MLKRNTRFTYRHPRIPYAVEFNALNEIELPDEADEIINKIYPSVQEGDQQLIQPLKQYIQRFPDIPQFKNHLYVVYLQGGKRRKADAVLREIREKHPHYLFGLVNEASRLVQAREIAAARRLLGSSLWLQDLYPDRQVFHISEVMTYYQAVIRLLLGEGEVEAAKERHQVLLEIDQDHPIAQEMFRGIALREMMSAVERLNKRAAMRKKVEARTTAPYPSTTEPPAFHHVEIAAFYRKDINSFSPVELKAIAALPRTTLATDLSRVLEDSLRRYHYFRQKVEEWQGWREDQLDFVSHAFRFLGALGYEECLPMVLDFFRQEDQVYDFWIGDALDSWTFPFLTRVAGQHLPTLQQFMQERYVGFSPKVAVSNAVAQLAWRDPARLPEVQAWFASLFEFYALHSKDKGLIDSDLIGWMAVEAGRLCLSELLPLVERLYQQGAVSEDIIGDWPKIVDLFEEPWDDTCREPLPENIIEAYNGSYRQRKVTHPPSEEDLAMIQEIESDPYAKMITELLSGEVEPGNMAPLPKRFSEKEEQKRAPVSSSPKVGRNEPCPCGSGRKFKHCCGKK
jgi:hypothetical protein